MDGGKKPSSPLSPPNLMVAANAGLTMRTVAPTTAAYSVKKRKGRIGQSLFRMITSRDFFCSERSSLLLTSLSRFSSSSKKKSFSLFLCFLLRLSYSIGPPPFLALSCKFSLSSRAAKNQSSMHSTTFDTKLFTFATCLCARFFCFREGINLATPASEGRLNFFFSPLFPNDIDVTKLTRQKIGLENF
jgi:hypothetical protein